MEKMKDVASDFLALRRVAVTRVSRNGKSHGSNVVYKRLRERGYQVFAVNPNADNVWRGSSIGRLEVFGPRAQTHRAEARSGTGGLPQPEAGPLASVQRTFPPATAPLPRSKVPFAPNHHIPPVM
jgi:hypothetical protein